MTDTAAEFTPDPANDEPSPKPAGNPRLVLAAGGSAPTDSDYAAGEATMFALQPGKTTIGSDSNQDIVLDALAAQHAVIQWIAEGDEFVFRTLDEASTIAGKPLITGLHHGDRLDLGNVSLIFQRDAGADHVRDVGARQGGDYAGGERHRPGGHQTE